MSQAGATPSYRLDRVGAHAAVAIGVVWALGLMLTRPSTAALERYVAAATLIEMVPNLRTLWFREWSRSLPYWPIRPLRPLAQVLFELPVLNAALVAVLLAGLLAVALGLAPVAPAVRISNALLFALLAFVDVPRFLRLQQAMFSCCAFCFSAPERLIELILGGVYLYSGISKAFMPAFHVHSSDEVCRPIRQAVESISGALGFSSRARTVLFRVVVAAIFLGEASIGIMCLDSALRGWFPDSVHFWFGAVAAVAMHGYVIAFVVLLPKVREPGILNWNMMCMALSWVLLGSHGAASGPIGLFSTWTDSAFLLAVVAIFLIYPASMYMGRCFAFEMSFSYFNGNMFGDVWFVLPRSVRNCIPTGQVHGHVLRVFEERGGCKGRYWEGASEPYPLPTYRELLKDIWGRQQGVSLPMLARQLGLALTPDANGRGRD